MKYNLSEFTIKVWGITVVIAPLLFGLILGIQSGSIIGSVTTVFLSFLMGGIYSIPGAMLFGLLSPLVAKNATNVYLIKTQLALLATIIVCLSIYLLTGFNGTMVHLVTCAYWLTMIICIFTCRLEMKKQKS